jgi:hypothetical protein
MIDVNDILFTQSTISANFKDGSPVQNLVGRIKAGSSSVDDLPTIRVVEIDGKFYSLDNRRLWVLKEVKKGKRNRYIKVDVKRMDDLSENGKYTIREELFGRAGGNSGKFTTKTHGKSIHPKDGVPNWIPREGPRGGLYIYDKEHKKVYLSSMSERQIRSILEKENLDDRVLDILAKALHRAKERRERNGSRTSMSTVAKRGEALRKFNAAPRKTNLNDIVAQANRDAHLYFPQRGFPMAVTGGESSDIDSVLVHANNGASRVFQAGECDGRVLCSAWLAENGGNVGKDTPVSTPLRKINGRYYG